MCTSLQPVTRLIQGEISEMEFLGRKSSGYFLPSSHEIMRQQSDKKQLHQQLRGLSNLYLFFIAPALLRAQSLSHKRASNYSDLEVCDEEQASAMCGTDWGFRADSKHRRTGPKWSLST